MNRSDHGVENEGPDRGGLGSRLLALCLRALLPAGVLAAGWGGYLVLSTPPEAPGRPDAKPRVLKTRAVELRVQAFRTVIETRGVVRPHNEVTLTSQVSGRIARIHPQFEDGAFFAEGDVLLEIDPSDYKTAVAAAEAQLARAVSAHAQEKARAEQARLNWEDLGYEEEPNELVLRLPQLREAEANVKAAEAQLEQARRNLERTKVRAPFDGRVRHRLVGVGQAVGPSTPLGAIFAVDYAEVRLPIAARDLRFLRLPETLEDPPLEVEFRDAVDETSTTVWKGVIVRTEGALDPSSLDLYAIARVFDPFGRTTGQPPLRIGQPVKARIPGRVLEDVVVIPRAAVRQLDRIVLIDPGNLTIHKRTIQAIFSDEEHVVVRDPAIPDGWLVATTHLIYAPEGSKVEILPDPEEELEGAVGLKDSKQRAAKANGTGQ